jgi:hypothetical protein
VAKNAALGSFIDSFFICFISSISLKRHPSAPFGFLVPAPFDGGLPSAPIGRGASVVGLPERKKRKNSPTGMCTPSCFLALVSYGFCSAHHPFSFCSPPFKLISKINGYEFIRKYYIPTDDDDDDDADAEINDTLEMQILVAKCNVLLTLSLEKIICTVLCILCIGTLVLRIVPMIHMTFRVPASPASPCSEFPSEGSKVLADEGEREESEKGMSPSPLELIVRWFRFITCKIWTL